QRSDGSRYDVEVSVELEESEERKIFVCIASDITKRLKHERQIEASLREKILLLGEVHHRVKNNLAIIASLLNIQAGNVDNAQINTILKENVNRIKSMAIIHQMLYEQEDYSGIDFELYLKKLMKTIEGNYSNNTHHIRSEIHAANIRLDISHAVPVALIINELLTNAYKHGCQIDNNCLIKVYVTRDDDLYTLIVSDNGVGLPAEFEIEKSTGMGMTLVRGLTGQLKGDFAVRQESGTAFIIRFKAI
ncbi:MAG: sensor histidine kinase, partial [Balneolales bacterium]